MSRTVSVEIKLQVDSLYTLPKALAAFSKCMIRVQ